MIVKVEYKPYGQMCAESKSLQSKCQTEETN